MEFKDVLAKRDEYKKKMQKGMWIASPFVLSCILFVALSIFNSGSKNGTIILSATLGTLISGFFIALLAFIIVLFATKKQAAEYQNAYKAYFVERNLAQVFSELHYQHDAGMPYSMLSSTGMVNMGDRYHSNDFVSGKYKDVAFSQADVHIEEEHRDSDGDTTYVTIFRGRFMIFEFPKPFTFRLEVAQKGFYANRIPKKDAQTQRKFERIKVESSEFNNMFKTYAEDGFEAFYLLDPAFINNILELPQGQKWKLLLGFLDNKLLVGLKDGKDAFEPPSVFKKLDEQTEMEKVSKEIRLITDFVDKLKLDKKIFR